MNWNPFKRIAKMERELNEINLSHNLLIKRVDLLGRTDDAQARWLSALEARLQDFNPVTISRADVEKAAGDAK